MAATCHHASRLRAAHLAFSFLLLLLAAGCRGDAPSRQTQTSAPAQGGAAAARAATEEAQRPRVVILGDSLTAGLGLLESQAFPALLQRKLDTDGYNFEVVNAGVSGDTSAGGLRRLDWALEGDVKVLIVALGANDGLRGLPVAEMKKNLGEIIERVRARNVMVLLAGMEAPPNFGTEYTVAFRNAYRDVALQQRVVFIPFLLDKVAGQEGLNQADGIHPNQQGAAVVADTVWSALRPVLDQIPASQ